MIDPLAHDTEPDTPAEAEPTEDGPRYPNAGEWVNDWLLPHYRRQLGGSNRRWDPNWWQYEEAGSALEALWQAFETLRLEPGTGMAVFFRDFLYPIMDRITAVDGPFWNHHTPPPHVDSNTIPAPWETTPTPTGWFRDAGDPREQ